MAYTARLLLGSGPYIISAAGYSASASVRGVTAANLSTTAGVRLALQDDGAENFSWSYRENNERLSFRVAIGVDGEGVLSDYVTRRDAVKALLDTRFGSLRLQYDTDLDYIDGRLSAGKYSAWTCDYQVVPGGISPSCVILAEFTGHKAILGAGRGSSGTSENPTGLEDQINYTIAQDERGVSAVYCRALFHGTAGTAYDGAAGALARGQAWLDLIKATPPAFVPTGSRFTAQTTSVGSQNEEAIFDAAWLTSSAQSGIADMSTTCIAAQFRIATRKQVLDGRAGAPGTEVQITVDLTYQIDANNEVFTATAPTPPSAETITGDAEKAVAKALTAAGVADIVRTTGLDLVYSSSGAQVQAVVSGVSGGSGVISWDQTIRRSEDLTYAVFEPMSDGSDVLNQAASPIVETATLSYTIVATQPVTPPTLSGYVITSRLPDDPVSIEVEGVTITRYQATISGRKRRSGGGGGGGLGADFVGGGAPNSTALNQQLANIARGT